MPKHVIEFNLPEDQDDLMLALTAGKMFGALWDFDQKLRAIVKYGQDGWDHEEIAKVRSLFHETLLENGVDLDQVA